LCLLVCRKSYRAPANVASTFVSGVIGPAPLREKFNSNNQGSILTGGFSARIKHLEE